MLKFNSILQLIDNQIYRLEGPDTAFHLKHCPSGEVEFYGLEHYHQELFVQLRSGEKTVFEKVAEKVLKELEKHLCSCHGRRTSKDAGIDAGRSFRRQRRWAKSLRCQNCTRCENAPGRHYQDPGRYEIKNIVFIVL